MCFYRFSRLKIKEKKRADMLSSMLQKKMGDIEEQSKMIKELKEQLKKGSTPQLEGISLETELVKELKNKFPKDRVEHHGKGGVNYKSPKDEIRGPRGPGSSLASGITGESRNRPIIQPMQIRPSGTKTQVPKPPVIERK